MANHNNGNNKDDFAHDKNVRVTANVVLIVVMTAVVIFILVVAVLRSKNQKMVESGYEITQGHIATYFDRKNTDAGSGRTIRYQYMVNSKVYLRAIYTSAIFPECDDSVGTECKKRRFWVIYSKEDPGKSLINLRIDLQNETNPKFPENIEDFV